jgi:5,10-methylenetetrahydromethanopterin reductase
MLGAAHPGVAARTAVWAEEAGWDGMLVVDSQNLSGDPFVALAMAARETSRLGLGTGVTNPATRHPAAAACAIATVQAESKGRAVLGIGRGDSSLAHLGLAPAPVGVFEDFLARLQGYLRGEEVAFGAPPGAAPAPGVDTLGLAGTPSSSRLHWLPPDLPKVPVEVAATGPRVLAAAGRHADRVMVAVGAEPERVQWAIDVARDAGATSFGAFVNVVAHPDPDVARRLASGAMSTFARFSVMHGGSVSGPVDEEQQEVMRSVRSVYDMGLHTRGSSPQAKALTPSFIDRFGVVGPPGDCARRLEELVGLGLSRIVAIGPAGPFLRGEAAEAAACFTEEVLPALAPVRD